MFQGGNTLMFTVNDDEVDDGALERAQRHRLVRAVVERIAENCEPALCTVLFMAGAGGSLRAGVISGAFCWFGFVVTTVLVNNAYQGRKLMLSVIDCGHWLGVLVIQGAVIGAMITMYASVASRTAEIGTLRALGFRRRSVLAAFLLEAALLGGTGGIFGLFFAFFMQLFTISTMNWQSFSELAFSFTLTPAISLKTIAFALFMGVVGGFLPAIRASNLKIVDALRAV